MADNLAVVATAEPHLMVRRPRSGGLSPYATKLAAQIVVLFSSVVVWGSVLDHAAYTNVWGGVAIYSVLVGLLSSLYLLVVLLLNYLAYAGTLSRAKFTHRLEMQLMMFLVVWWAAGIGAVASVHEVSDAGEVTGVTTGTGVTSGWIAFFGSAFASYKAYHAFLADHTKWNFADFGSSASDDEDQVPLAEPDVAAV